MGAPAPVLGIALHHQNFAVCQLDPTESIPAWAVGGLLWSVTRTPEELSVVCLQAQVPEGVRCEYGWRCLKVEGPLEFALVGVLAGLTATLARVGVSLFALSTYDTDYLLVRETDLERALAELRAAGHRVTAGSA